jgi:hypothetical protein
MPHLNPWEKHRSTMRDVFVLAVASAMSVCAGFPLPTPSTRHCPRCLRKRPELSNFTFPCVNRDLPFSISNQSGTDVFIRLNGSSVMQGCSDNAISFKPIDVKTLDGAVEDGRKVKLIRE